MQRNAKYDRLIEGSSMFGLRISSEKKQRKQKIGYLEDDIQLEWQHIEEGNNFTLLWKNSI